MKSVCAFAPATIANVNIGFDVLGLALSSIGDKVEVAFNGTDKNRIVEILGGADLPHEVEKNCCSVVIAKMQENLGRTEGVDIRINKGFPSGSGLGSSSASSAASAFAYNALLSEPFDKKELVKFASEGERIACGSAHFDNVAPAILGGMILVRNGKFISLPFPTNVYVISFYPKVRINTSDSRGILRQTVPVSVMGQQVANMGSFVASLFLQDLNLMSESLKDMVVEPVRKLLIPKFEEMRNVAQKKNALAFGISGSGPSVFAFAKNIEDATQIQDGFSQIYDGTDIKTQSFIELLKDNTGAKLCNYL